jgi:hypothetical protein
MADATHEYSTYKTVTKQFRDKVLELYPGLKDRKDYWRFMAVLLFSVRVDKDTGKRFIPHEVIAEIEDKLAHDRYYRSEHFLEKFQKDVMTPATFTWSDWSHKGKKARMFDVVWKDDLIAALKMEKSFLGVRGIKRVSFVSGRVYTRKQRKIDYDEIRLKTFRDVLAREPAAQELLDYLNARDQAMYTRKFYENIDSVKLAIDNEDKDKEHYYNILSYLEQFPKPYYHPSEDMKTDRIFMGHWLLLKREYRQLLAKGWQEFDLKYSQVAICASLWQIQEVNDFLLRGGNVWQEIFDALKLNYGIKFTNRKLYDKIKGSLKDVLYPLLFGMSNFKITQTLKNDRLIQKLSPGAESLFFDNWLIQALLNARSKKIEEIKRVGHITTCFGRNIKVDSDEGNILSLMAVEAQALELKLLLPVVKYAQDNNEFQITLWCHDGFYVNFVRRDRAALNSESIVNIVKRGANSHKIVTELET